MEPINIQETVISELEEEKGNFLCGPEWKVKITTKAGQELDIKQVSDGDFIKHSRQSLHLQIEDGPDFRVLISPLPPKVEEEVKEVKKVIKKKNDNRSTISTQIFRSIFWPFECSDICTAGVRSTSVSAGCTTSRPREFLSSKLRPEWPVENVRLNILYLQCIKILTHKSTIKRLKKRVKVSAYYDSKQGKRAAGMSRYSLLIMRSKSYTFKHCIVLTCCGNWQPFFYSSYLSAFSPLWCSRVPVPLFPRYDKIHNSDCAVKTPARCNEYPFAVLMCSMQTASRADSRISNISRAISMHRLTSSANSPECVRLCSCLVFKPNQFIDSCIEALQPRQKFLSGLK